MIILALDTASEHAGVAIRRDGRTLAEDRIETRDGHSQVLISMVERVLAQAKITLKEVDCFASSSGPGSFTGVRIGLTTIKGFAEGLGRPATGISRLRALAALGTAKLRSPVIDARRGDIYTAIYDNAYRLISSEVVVRREEWRPGEEVESIESATSLASMIAACAEWDGVEKWGDAAQLDANYVRRSDAQLYWSDVWE